MNHYCNQKFWYLQVNPERQEINSCCEAKTEKINLSWLRENPGQLFNTNQLVNERKAMLANQAVPSCYNNCQLPESQGLLSRRTRFNGTDMTHTDVNAHPTELNIKIGTDCNLTCSYCNRYASTAWLRDVANNGAYLEQDERFQITTADRAILKLGQKALVNNNSYQEIINTVVEYKHLTKVEITGGEPFLYNELPNIINKLSNQVHINIVTGLGIDHKRLHRILLQLPQERVTLSVSAENLGSLYEFNRYGNSYSNLLKNLDVVKELSIPVVFYSVLSNVTVFGLNDFLRKFDHNVDLNVCVDPAYLSAHVIDDVSKELVLLTDYGKFTKDVHAVVSKTASTELREQAAKFINEFARRRQLDLNIFPGNFTTWLNT